MHQLHPIPFQLFYSFLPNIPLFAQPHLAERFFLLDDEELEIVLLPDAVRFKKRKLETAIFEMLCKGMEKNGLVDHLQRLGTMNTIVFEHARVGDVDEDLCVLTHDTRKIFKKPTMLLQRNVFDHIEQSDKVKIFSRRRII